MGGISSLFINMLSNLFSVDLKCQSVSFSVPGALNTVYHTGPDGLRKTVMNPQA